MKPAEDSPFFYRCHLKASRKEPDGKSECVGQERSEEGEPDREGRWPDASDYTERDASGSLDGD
jgi:hypothetical protein